MNKSQAGSQILREQLFMQNEADIRVAAMMLYRTSFMSEKQYKNLLQRLDAKRVAIEKRRSARRLA